MHKPVNGVSFRILLVDKCAIYRRGLRSFVETAIAHAAVCEASSLSEALSLTKSERYDLILVDFEINSLQAFTSLKKARDDSPSTRWAVISSTDARTDILASLTAGFHGFISKNQSDDQILGAISDLLSGRIFVPSSLAENGIGEGCDRSLNNDAPVISGEAECLTLSARQREVLLLLARGMSNKEIAEALHIAESTSKIHTAAVLRALGVRNRTEAAIKAMKLIEIDA